MNVHRRLSTCRPFVTLLLVFTTFYFANPITALAEDGLYTLVGSTGSVDEASLDLYEFDLQVAMVKAGVITGTVILRYNLPPAETELWPADDADCPCPEVIRIRYKDNPNGANVIVRLKEANLLTNGTATLYEFNSDSATDSKGKAIPANNIAKQTFDSDSNAYNFNFVDKEYFFEVELTKTNVNGQPELVGIGIGNLP
jgi:hypothetical protein